MNDLKNEVIYCDNIIIENSNYTNNFGGLKTKTILINNTYYNNNYFRIYAENGTVNNCTFKKNFYPQLERYANLGAMTFRKGNITNCSFINNYYIDIDGDTYISDCIFTNNEVFTIFAVDYLINCKFINNTGDGKCDISLVKTGSGVIYLYSKVRQTLIKNCEFYNNGGLYDGYPYGIIGVPRPETMELNEITIENCTLTDNKGNYIINIIGDNNVTFINSTLKNNTNFNNPNVSVFYTGFNITIINNGEIKNYLCKDYYNNGYQFDEDFNMINYKPKVSVYADELLNTYYNSGESLSLYSLNGDFPSYLDFIVEIKINWKVKK